MSRMSRWCGNVTLAGLDTTEAPRFSIIAFKITTMLQTPIHLSCNILRILQLVISTSWTETLPNIAEGGFLEHLDGSVESNWNNCRRRSLPSFFPFSSGGADDQSRNVWKYFYMLCSDPKYLCGTHAGAASRGGWRRLANESLAVCRLIRTSGNMLHAAIKQAQDQD